MCTCTTYHVSYLNNARYNYTLSGTQQMVNVLVFGSATHVLPRRMAVANTLAQQEQGASEAITSCPNRTFFHQKAGCGTDATINTTWMKALLTRTHTNTHNWELCSQKQYTQLIGWLEATKSFQ